MPPECRKQMCTRMRYDGSRIIVEIKTKENKLENTDATFRLLLLHVPDYCRIFANVFNCQ